MPTTRAGSGGKKDEETLLSDEDKLLADDDHQNADTDNAKESAVSVETATKLSAEKTTPAASCETPTDEKLIPMSQVQNLIQQQMNSIFQSMFSQATFVPAGLTPILTEEQKQWTKWDREYVTPPFSIRTWSDNEKLFGPKNFKPWKSNLLLDLRALNLVPFIESEKATNIPLSPTKRDTLDAQALQVIRATVAKNLHGRLQKVQSAFQAMKFLTDMFDGLEAHYLVKLHNRFQNLRFRPGFDPIRFVSEFEDFIEEYALHGTTFGAKYTVTLFLQKIDGIYESSSPFYTYYNMICQDENQSFSHVKEKFLSVDLSNYKGILLFSKTCNVRNNISDDCISDNFVCGNMVGSGQQVLKISRSMFLGSKRKLDINKENVHPSGFKKSTNTNKTSTQSSGTSGSSGSVKSLKEKYTAEQLQRLKAMSKEEKNKVRCSKCGEFFHEAAKCPNPGRMCFKCFRYGHEKKDCPELKGKTEYSSEKFNKTVPFLVDTGASYHAVCEKHWLIEYESFDTVAQVTTADKQKSLSSFGEGLLPILLKFGKQKSVVVLNKVQYIPDLTEPVISVRKFNKQFWSYLRVNATSGFLFSSHLKRKISLVSINNDVYYIHVSIMSSSSDSCSSNQNSEISINAVKITKKSKLLDQEGEMWHRRMGHISASYLQKLVHVTSGTTEFSCQNLKQCQVCTKSKMTRKVFNKVRDRADHPCQIVHADLIGPINPKTYVTQHAYVLSVIDDYTRLLQVFTLKTKNETPKCMKDALLVLKSRFPNQFSILRCDNGTEFLNTAMQVVLDEFGISAEPAEPYTHEHNGTVERLNRTLEERTRALLLESGFPQQLWGQVIQSAVWLYNRTPHSSLEFLTPYEKFYNVAPDLKQIRIVGSRAEVLKETLPSGKKFESRSSTCYLVGFYQTGYVLFDPQSKKTIKSCNVKIDETNLYRHDFPSKSEILEIKFNDDEPSSSPDTTVEPPSSTIVATVEDKGNSSDDETEIIEMDYDWEDDIDPTINLLKEIKPELYQFDDTPVTYKDAINGPKSHKWQEAIKNELKSITEHRVWEVVSRIPGMQVIPVKWLFRIKEDGTYKARLVAVGCKEKNKPSPFDKAAPTPPLCIVRWALALAAQFSWYIVQLDVTTAFLNGNINSEKYVAIPEGINKNPKEFVCRLNKALYGLSISPKLWNDTIDKFLKDLSFKQSPREPCVYSKMLDSKFILLLIYVDDILLLSNDKKLIDSTCEGLKEKFSIKLLGYPKRFLGIDIQKLDDNSIFVSQPQYIDEMLKEFNMSDCLIKSTPMIPIGEHNNIPNNNDKSFPYRSAIGKLLYLSTTTRPDISFPVSYLARFQNDPQDLHWTLVKRVLRYLKGTKFHGLLFKSKENHDDIIDCFVDADLAGDKSRKSTTGYIIRMFGTPVMWTSRLQSTIAESSSEAEYVAMCDSAHSILFLARLTDEIIPDTFCKIKYPVKVYEDNTGAIGNSASTSHKSKLKFIELRYLKMKEYYASKLLVAIKIESAKQLADILTKALLESKFVGLRDKVMTLNLCAEGTEKIPNKP